MVVGAVIIVTRNIVLSDGVTFIPEGATGKIVWVSRECIELKLDKQIVWDNTLPELATDRMIIPVNRAQGHLELFHVDIKHEIDVLAELETLRHDLDNYLYDVTNKYHELSTKANQMLIKVTGLIDAIEKTKCNDIEKQKR